MFKNRFFTFVVIPVLVAVMALTVREAVATSAIALDPGARKHSACSGVGRLTRHAGPPWENTTSSWKSLRACSGAGPPTAHVGTPMREYYERIWKQSQTSAESSS